MSVAEAHRLVDVRRGSDAFFYQPHGRVAEQQAKPARDKAGDIAHDDSFFAERRDKRFGGFARRVGRPLTDDDFDKLHAMRGIEEMQADDATRSACRFSDGGNAHGRRIRGEYGVGGRGEGEAPEDVELDGFVLGRGLDDDSRGRDRLLERRATAKRRHARACLGVIECFRQPALYGCSAFEHRVIGDVVDRDGESGREAGPRDAPAHRAGADHGDPALLLLRHRLPPIRRLCQLDACADPGMSYGLPHRADGVHDGCFRMRCNLSRGSGCLGRGR